MRRLALLLPTWVGVSIVVFVLVRLLPGDAVALQLQDARTTAGDEAALRSQLGLDRPIAVQYVDWLGTLARGDLMRLVHTQMLEVLRQHFIRAAAAKGLAEYAIVMRHALKNAFIPALTVLGLQVTQLVSGTVVLESIFVLPGMGRYLLESVQA